MAHRKGLWLTLSGFLAVSILVWGGVAVPERPKGPDATPLQANSGPSAQLVSAGFPLNKGFAPKIKPSKQNRFSATRVAVGPGPWVNIGPVPILTGSSGFTNGPYSGRIEDIAVDPNSPSTHWWIAAALGGVWETTDGGTNWAPKTDDQASLITGAIALGPGSPINILYAGTGNPYVAFGPGLLRSTNGGSTWQLLSSSLVGAPSTDPFKNATFMKLKVDPRDTTGNIVLAAVYSKIDPLNPSVDNPSLAGIFRSTDAASQSGVSTWTQTKSGRATDLAVDPTNFDRQYVAIGSSGLSRSLNAGVSWTAISGPWSNVGGFIKLAISPSQTGTLYVSIQSALTGKALGIWRTDNAWVTPGSPSWTSISANPFDDETPLITVDPSNANILYAGTVNVYKFNGTVWTIVSRNIHADLHTFAWAGARLIAGTDGGPYSTTDGADSWTSHSTNLATNMLLWGSLHPTNPNFALVGSQDTGTNKWTGSNAWDNFLGGDGGDNAIVSGAAPTFYNPATNRAATFSNSGGPLRTTDGNTFVAADSGITDLTNKVGLRGYQRMKECPSKDDTFIFATNRIWKTTNFFSSAPSNPSWSINSPTFANISALAFAKSDLNCNTYTLGTDDGQLWITTNGGTTWQNLDLNSVIPNRSVNALAFDPQNSNNLFVALAGFDEASPAPGGHLFKTTNATGNPPTWTEVTPRPSGVRIDFPHYAVAIDPSSVNIVYLGTERGLWKSVDSGSTWTVQGVDVGGIPKVVVEDLVINSSTNRLIAFTHGRGAYVLGAPPPVGPDLVEISVSGPASGTVGSPLTLSDTVCNAGTAAVGSFFVGLFLSQDNSITTSDVLVTRRQVVSGLPFVGPPLNQHSCSGVSTTATIPSMPAGTYYIGAIADDQNQIVNEINNNKANNVRLGNTSAKVQTIAISNGADLVETSASVTGSTTVGNNGTITIDDTVTNIGNGATLGFDVTFFLTNVSRGDQFLGSRTVNSGLPANGSSHVISSIQVPSFMPAGTYVLKAIADAINKIPEANENNNSFTGTQQITIVDTVPPFPPSGLTAAIGTIGSAVQVNLSWLAGFDFTGVTSYRIFRCPTNNSCPTNPTATVAGTVLTFSDSINPTPGTVTTFLYKVYAVDAAGNVSPASNIDYITTIVFSEALVATQTTVKAQHITELRTAVNAVRVSAGLPQFTAWTDANLQAGIITIKAAHVQELRDKLNEARTATSLGLTALSFTDPTLTPPGSTVVKKVHIDELRQGVKGK